MQNQMNAEHIVESLKKAIICKKDVKIKASKIVLNLLIDYVRLRVIEKNELSQKVFIDFYNNPNSDKLFGKLEAWIEIAIRDNSDSLGELSEKIKSVEDFYKENSDKENSKDTEVESAEPENSNEEEEVEELEGKRPIIVPWDFSDVANFALNHALMYSKTTGDEIILLHITKHDKEIESASQKMAKIVADMKQKGVELKVMVETGNILKTITQIANDKNARFVIMGTHGIKGMQKFTGSLALKVITGTAQPFIVVQNNPEQDTVKTIAFPVDNRRESKQKLRQVVMLAKFYKIKYVLTMPEEISNSTIRKNMKQNLAFIKSYMSQQGIAYEVVYVKGTNNFADAVLKYAEQNRPDMMIILTTKNINIQDYVLAAEEQKIIANPSKIPVMCINPIKAKYVSAKFSGVVG